MPIVPMSKKVKEDCIKVMEELRPVCVNEINFVLPDLILPIRTIPTHWRVIGRADWIGKDQADEWRNTEFWLFRLDTVLTKTNFNIANVHYLSSVSVWDGWKMEELNVHVVRALTEHVRTLLYHIEAFERKFPPKPKEGEVKC